jgi:rhodanese-related sulfurtransferase
MALLTREGYRFCDLRPARQYDDEHLVKPARASFNVPWNDGSSWLARLQAQCPSTATKLLLVRVCSTSVEAPPRASCANPPARLKVCDDGEIGSPAAAQQLAAAGYRSVLVVEGGYAGWNKVNTLPAGGSAYVMWKTVAANLANVCRL